MKIHSLVFAGTLIMTSVSQAISVNPQSKDHPCLSQAEKTIESEAAKLTEGWKHCKDDDICDGGGSIEPAVESIFMKQASQEMQSSIHVSFQVEKPHRDDLGNQQTLVAYEHFLMNSKCEMFNRVSGREATTKSYLYHIKSQFEREDRELEQCLKENEKDKKKCDHLDLR